MLTRRLGWKALALVPAALALVSLGPSTYAAASGAERVTLLRSPSGTCAAGATGGTRTDAFAIVDFRPGGTVSAEVTVRDGAPHAMYAVSLVQVPSGERCFIREATLTTNGRGYGAAHLSEAVLRGTGGAFVMVFGPDFRATGSVPRG